MEKPFDKIFSDTMIQVSKDILNEFGAYTIFTQSDEITVLLPSLRSKTVINGDGVEETIINKGWTHTSSGRTQKLASLMSGFCTMSFNLHFSKFVKDLELEILNDINTNETDRQDDLEYFLKMQEKVQRAWFDARVYGVNDADAVNSFIWRNRDCEKNSRSMFASTFCSHKELQNKNGLEQVEFCKAKTGNDWNLIEDHYKYGTFIKKERYLKPVSGGTMDYGQTEFVERSRIKTYSEKIAYTDEVVGKIMRKYL